MAIDDFLRQAEEDERADATKLPVIQYAKMRKMYPQKVYAVIRKGKLKEHWCDCGRKVVIIEEADQYFKLGRFATTDLSEAEEEVPGSDVDSPE
jgi:hypothetical protein